MKKNPKPLTILVTDRDLLDSPELQTLEQKGHTVLSPYRTDCWSIGTPDVIIGPQCWRIDLALGKLAMQLKLMETAVRNIKYPKIIL